MGNKNKILMLLDNAFNPDLRVLKEITSLTNLGFKIDLVCWDQEGKLEIKEERENFNIHRVRVVAKKQQGVKKIFDLIKFYKAAKKQINNMESSWDYIYVHDLLMLPLCVNLKFKMKIPLIYDAHEIYHLMEWEKYPSPLRKLIFGLEKYLLKYVDEFIVVNEKRRAFYKSYYSSKEIHIIGNWYDPYDGEELSLRKEYNIPENGILLSYFGVINFDERPVDKIIKSVDKMENVYLFIAGVGKHDAEVSKIAENNEKIYYLGWQKNIRKYLKDINFIIYYLNDSRKYFEYTAPNTLYLALTHEIPLITNVPGESEMLISEHNTGYFIKDVKDIENSVDFDFQSENNLRKKESIAKIKNNFEWSENEKKYSQIFNALKQN